MQKQTDFLLCAIWLVMELEEIFTRNHRCQTLSQIGRGIKLRPGMTLAIEPMVNAGDYDVWVLEDDWTVVTTDSMKSAHYENTILITEGEPEIFSWKEGLA